MIHPLHGPAAILGALALVACSGDSLTGFRSDLEYPRAFGADEQVWAVDYDEPPDMIHFDGDSWAEVESDLPGGEPWAASTDDLWVAFDGRLWRSSDALQWLEENVAVETVGHVFGSGPDDVWVSGIDGSGLDAVRTLLHWDGDTWTTNIEFRPLLMGDVDLTKAGRGCSYSADDVWFVVPNPEADYDDVLLHWDGNAWTLVDAPSWYVSPLCEDNGLWLIQNVDGEASRLYRREADEWIRIELPTEDMNPEISFRFAAGTETEEAWLAADDAVGPDPHIWHVMGPDVIEVEADLERRCGSRRMGEGCFDDVWVTESGRVFAFPYDGVVFEVSDPP